MIKIDGGIKSFFEFQIVSYEAKMTSIRNHDAGVNFCERLRDLKRYE